MERAPGDEATLLRAVLARSDGLLQHYNLRLSYTIDVEDNSFTTQVLQEGLDYVGVLVRLEQHDKFQSILEEIVSAPNVAAKERAIQRARCELDQRALRVAE